MSSVRCSQTASCICALVLGAAAPAAAQNGGWQDRAFLNVNLAVQAGARPFSDVQTPRIYTQPASIVSTSGVPGGALPLEVAGGARVWQSLGVGVAYSRFALTDVADVTASIPSPVASNAPRPATASAKVKRADMAFHLLAVWLVPITDHIDVALSGGPSFVRIKQDRVGGVAIEEDSPTFATVAISKVGVAPYADSVVGVNGGADVTYFLTPMLGVGGGIRFVRASSQAGGGRDGRAPVDAGGLQLAVGVRVRAR